MPRQRPTTLDWALAAAVLVAAEVELVLGGIEPLPVAMGLTFVAAASLAFRRAYPVAVVALCIGATAASTIAGVPVDKPVVPLLWIFICMYSVAAYCPLPRAVLGLVVGLALFASTLIQYSEDLLFGLAIIGSPWLVGRAMRSRVGETSELADRVADLEQTREEEVLRAAEAERAKIARDLHDVVAHSVSVMVVQAGAAAAVIDQQPRKAAETLELIQTVGREALTEMSALVGLLRNEQGVQAGSPHPGLADLEDLIDHSTNSGVQTDLVIVGEPRPIPAGLQLSIFRVVQEALTNIRKHTTDAHAKVCLTYLADELLIDITDDGTATGSGPGGKLGVVGMRERITAYGGTLEVGALEHGFAVRARVPLEARA